MDKLEICNLSIILNMESAMENAAAAETPHRYSQVKGENLSAASGEYVLLTDRHVVENYHLPLVTYRHSWEHSGFLKKGCTLAQIFETQCLPLFFIVTIFDMSGKQGRSYYTSPNASSREFFNQW